MDFNRTQISSLLNNISHEKAKYINILHRLKTLLSLQKNHKLILDPTDKLVFTSFPQKIYENVNFPHPILKIFLEFLGRTKKMGEGDKFFVNALIQLIEPVSVLLDNGIKPKVISDSLKDMSYIINSDTNTNKSSIIDEDIDVTGNEIIFNNELKEYIINIIGDEYISTLLVECIQATKSFDTEKIRICKVQTGSLEDSYRTNGMVIDRKPEGSIQRLTSTTVGMFNCPLDIVRTELKGTVLLTNHEDLLNFSINEMESAKKLVDSLNVNVLIISGNINELFMDFIDGRNILVLRVFNKYDMKRICDLIGGNIYNSLGPVPMKGFVKEISIEVDGGRSFTKITTETNNVNTIVLKGSIKEVLDETERKIVAVLENLKTINMRSITDRDEDMGSTVANIYDLGCADSCISAIMAKMKEYGKSTSDGAISSVIVDIVCNGLRSVENRKMLLNDQRKCIVNCFEFLATILEIDDYLVAKMDQLNVKPPQTGHWDDD